MPLFPLPPLAGIAINVAVLAALVSEEPVTTLTAFLAPTLAAIAYLVIKRFAPRQV